ncbi:MAG: hypothetical protein WCK05_12415 [Planctomycetota bacterium]
MDDLLLGKPVGECADQGGRGHAVAGPAHRLRQRRRFDAVLKQQREGDAGVVEQVVQVAAGLGAGGEDFAGPARSVARGT